MLITALVLVCMSSNALSGEFAGSPVCGECHQQQFSEWAGSHHDWALKPPVEKFVLGDFDDASFSHQGVDSRFYTRGGKFYVETGDADGQIQEYEVKYAVGITPLQQYLVETQPGRLQALDLAWDADRQRWFHLYPGEQYRPRDGLHWTGPYKNWNSRCAVCHQTDYRKNYDAATDSYHSTWSETSIGCESCHGPGQAHIERVREAMEGVDTGGGYTDSGLQAEFGSGGQKELDVCMRCHSRRSAIDPDSVPVGESFDDHHRLAHLDPGLYFADGQILDEVYVAGSFLQSKMYASGVTCSNCHNPHSLELKATGNALCTQCHNPAGNPEFSGLVKDDYDSIAHHHHEPGTDGAACVNCHMPSRTYMQIDPRRDHSFRVPRPDLTESLGTPNACNGCHDEKDSAWAVEAIEGWEQPNRMGSWHYGKVLSAGRMLDSPESDAVEMLADLVRDPDQPAIVRATALDLLRPVASGDILALAGSMLEDESVLLRTSAVGLLRQADAGQRIETLVPALDDPARSVRIDAASALIDIPAEQIPEAWREKFSATVGEYQASLLVNADFPETQMAIAGVALTRRNAQAALAALDTATGQDSGLIEAWRLKSRIESALGEPEKARRTLEQGLALNPQNHRLLVTLAEYYLGQGNQVDALNILFEAMDADPEDVYSRNLYADLLLRNRNFGQVIEFLYSKDGNLPRDPEGLFMLAMAAQQQANMQLHELATAALRRRFPSHPLLSRLDQSGRVPGTIPQ